MANDLTAEFTAFFVWRYCRRGLSVAILSPKILGHIVREPFYLQSRKRWYVKIQLPDGRLKQVQLGEKKSEAFARWRSMTHELNVADSVTVGDVVLAFTQSMQAAVEVGSLGKKTMNRRIDLLTSFLDRVDETMKASDLKPHHVMTFLESKPSWNVTTRSDCGALIKLAFKWAFEQGHTLINPLAALKIAKPKSREYAVDRATHEKLIEYVWREQYPRRRAASFRLVLLGLWLSGCRPSELLAVNIEDSDRKSWTLRNHKNKKKTGKSRVVFLSPCLQTLGKIASHGRSSGRIFQPDPKRTWQYSDIRRRFERLKKRAKIDSACVLYSYRHSWITRALLAGIDAATVATLAGTSIRMIDRHYGHLSRHRDHLFDAVAKINQRPEA